MARTIFKTHRKENFRSQLNKLYFNFFPAYRRTGARVCFMSADYSEIHVKLRLYWATRNYVGTVFGGSIYGAVDPIYMLQLIKILGKDYIVWDKSATMKFIKPVKKTVYARFVITPEILHEIKTKIAADKKYDIHLPVTFEDEGGTVYVEVTKTLYVADAAYYKARKATKENK
jgi:hypothetical protein